MILLVSHHSHGFCARFQKLFAVLGLVGCLGLPQAEEQAEREHALTRVEWQLPAMGRRPPMDWAPKRPAAGLRPTVIQFGLECLGNAFTCTFSLL